MACLMIFKIICEIWIKCHAQVLKHCQVDAKKKIVQLNKMISQCFINFNISMMGEFLLLKKTTAIKSYSVRAL